MKSKQKLIGQRISLWENGTFLKKGSTGKIISSPSKKGIVDVEIDGRDTIVPFFLSELYFQNHEDGYNQPCFR
jgi:hypothetical protein